MYMWVPYHANEYIDCKTIAAASVFALFKGEEAGAISKQLCGNKVVGNSSVMIMKLNTPIHKTVLNTNYTSYDDLLLFDLGQNTITMVESFDSKPFFRF